MREPPPPPEELAHDPHVLRCLGPVGRMRAVLEHVHPGARHASPKILDGFGNRFVVAAGQEQHRQLQLAQPIRPIVVAQQSGRGELSGAPHVPIHLVAAGDAFTFGDGGQRLGATNKVLLEHVVCGHACRIIGGLHGLALVQRRLDRLRKRESAAAGYRRANAAC